MRVSDIASECREALGNCSEDLLFQSITRAIELLANKGLFDPLIGTLDFTVDNGYLIALPRDVKTPIRLNIDNNPSFARNRIYEFSPNGAGTNDGEEIGWQWHERGYSCIQDEKKLPSLLRYVVTNAADVGKTLTIKGLDPTGFERSEMIVGALSNATPSEYEYAEVTSVVRETTASETYLNAVTGTIARYYPDEEQPEYRVVKISKTGVAVRMIYRKHVFKITSMDDIIPLHSPMAVIRAVDAVGLMRRKQYDEAKAVMEEAALMISEEQASRDEGESISGAIEIQSALNQNINTNDVLIVADVYDMAAEIFGPIGKQKIFDRITDALAALSNKAQWDSLIGECTLRRCLNYEDQTSGQRQMAGYFVLPRSIGAVLAMNLNCQPAMPRNRWFEFHMNGTGSTRYASCGTWDDKGETPILNFLPRVGRVITPVRLIAVPDNALDVDKRVTVYGIERRADGAEVAIWRNGIEGYAVPQKTLPYSIPSDAPQIVRIDRIDRVATIGYIGLTGLPIDGGDEILLGYWQPDELAPTYRMIRVPGCCHSTIQIRYRKRTNKVSSLFDVLNLRSRLAMESMMRAIAVRATDPNSAAMHEAIAVQYLEDEQMAMNPHGEGGLQFDPESSPGYNYNIQ